MLSCQAADSEDCVKIASWEVRKRQGCLISCGHLNHLFIETKNTIIETWCLCQKGTYGTFSCKDLKQPYIM